MNAVSVIAACFFLLTHAGAVAAEETPKEAIRTTWRELTKNPKEYSGKRVSFVGVIVYGFEVMVIVSPTDPNNTPIQDRMWFDYAEFPPPESESRGFKKLDEPLKNAGIDDEPTKVIVHVEGIFKHSPLGGLGHLGGFSSQLTLERIHFAKPFSEPKSASPASH